MSKMSKMLMKTQVFGDSRSKMSKMSMKTQLSGELTVKCIAFTSFSLIWGVQSKGVPFDQLCNPRVLPLAGLGNPIAQRPQNVKNVNENTAFWRFDVKNVHENTAFWQVDYEMYWFS